MPSTIQSSGPAAIMLGFPLGAPNGVFAVGPLYLFGWCERSPVISMISAAAPLYNTLGGVELPYAYSFQGSEYEITCTFTRWNPFVADWLREAYSSHNVESYAGFFQTGAFAVSIAIFYPVASVFMSAFHRIMDFFPIVRVARMVPHDLGNQGEKLEVVFHGMRMHLTSRMPSVLGAMTSGEILPLRGNEISGAAVVVNSASDFVIGNYNTI